MNKKAFTNKSSSRSVSVRDIMLFLLRPILRTPTLRNDEAGGSAFTLIELLVVVLIIGILSAIALPQYQIAVAKSRVATMFALGKAIANAQTVYHLNNDGWALNLENLDVQLPASCSSLSELDNEQHTRFACGNDFTLDNDIRNNGALRINYCPGNNTDVRLCEQKRDLQINFSYTKGANCEIQNSSALGKRICASMGKATGNSKVYDLE